MLILTILLVMLDRDSLRSFKGEIVTVFNFQYPISFIILHRYILVVVVDLRRYYRANRAKFEQIIKLKWCCTLFLLTKLTENEEFSIVCHFNQFLFMCLALALYEATQHTGDLLAM